MFRDVFLISIDCLRPDYLGAYNLLRRQTPNLDGLARGSALFTQAVSHAPFTTPALASLLTGRYPYQTGVRLLLGQLCDAGVETLAEFARRAGYLTAGFPSTFILNSPTGLGRGFDHYRDVQDGVDTGRGGCWQKGDRLNQALDEFLAGAGRRRVFCWLHYFDLHDYHLDKGLPIEASYPRDLGARIDRDCVGELIGILRRRGRFNEAAFILTADHGEDLFQHGHRGHGHHLYDTVLRVPLIWNLKEPSLARRIDGQVRHVDIMPTLLELWGFPGSGWPAGLDGRSLVPLLRGHEAPQDGEPRPADCSYAEASPGQLFEGDLKSYRAFSGPEQRSLRTGGYKFIAHAGGRRELYDLRDDPLEMADIAGACEELADRFAGTLAEMTAGGDDRFRQIEFSPDEQEKVMSRLRELGYVA
jgi:arylsulfatase A-like enzyme